MILKQKAVASATFINEVPIWRSSLLIPFVVLYGVLGYISLYPEMILEKIPDTYIEEFHIKNRHMSGLTLLLIPLFGFIQVLVGLTTLWSPTTRAWVLFVSCRDVNVASHLFIKSKPNKGHTCIAPITLSKEGKKQISHANRIYTWCTEQQRFIKPELPTKNFFSTYQKHSGLTRNEAADNFLLFGENKFVIPIPSFKMMLVEHATAPFFVFQMFCVLLWMLDDYWAMSLLTGVMLVIFEGTVVQQRIKNLFQLREMETSPILISVMRQGSWTAINSTQVVPGDIIMFGSGGKKFNIPCDILVLEGSVVVNESLLTGETTPLVKESITTRPGSESLCIKKDRTHILFSGTTALQCTPATDSTKGGKGPVGYVLRTGFETTQGALVRKIVNNSLASTTAGSGEALAFIACLLIFAVISSAYVLYHGLRDPLRSRYKLLLSCTIIVTSVVPPELPMELALAVNMSFLLLQRLRIFCTEPFRIPLAGALDTCCFDKTGTLTADVMVLQGTVNPVTESSETPGEATASQRIVLGGCHSLLYLNNEICGDPMEKAGFQGSNWTMSSSGLIENSRMKGKSLTVVTRFPFSAVLKRMSCVVRYNGEVSAVLKGAPETLKKFFSLSEADQQKYDESQQTLSKMGFRVIALGMASMKSHVTDAYAKRMKRTDLESADFDFLGFAVFACPIREDAYTTINTLINASQRVVMITGDNTNTAAYVAQELKMISSTKSDHIVIDSPEAVSAVLSNSSKETDHLIVSGDAFQDDTSFSIFLKKYVTKVEVFARCNPDQKEDILVALNKSGATTLMCGDGTNDVGALSQSHVGVGLLAGCTSAKPIEKVSKDADPLSIPEPLPEDMGFISIFQWKMREKARVQKYREKIRTEYSQAYTKAIATKKPPPPQPSLEGLRIDGGVYDEGDYCSVVQLGDASMAAPFTAKNSSTKACCHLLRLGRCTLVTTLQMYRVMALNCLSSAFSLSVLTNEGIKCSDSQMTVTSIVVTICFLCMSRSTPSSELSKRGPHTKVFCPYIILTIIAQFSIHLYAMLECRKLVFGFAEGAVDGVLPERENFDAAEFKPCLMNSVLFLLSNWQLIFVFVANYQGAPYMTSLTENRPMLYCLIILSLFVLECTVQSTGIASYLEFVDLWQYEGLVITFLNILMVNAIAAVSVDRVLSAIFRAK